MPFKQVVGFQEKILTNQRPSLGLFNYESLGLLTRQLTEEVQEMNEGHDADSVVDVVDALIDNIYFAIGGLHKLGLTPEQMEECFMSVHDANMTKKRGEKVRGGIASSDDAIKPSGWQSPEHRIAYILGVNYQED